MASKGQESSSSSSTKQLLDELDALMEKMLSLPVSTVDEPAPLPEEATRLPRLSATLTVLEGTPAEPANPTKAPGGVSDNASAPILSPRRDEPATTNAPHADFSPHALSRTYAEEALASPARTPGTTSSPRSEKPAPSGVSRTPHWSDVPVADIPEEAIPPSLLQVKIPDVDVLPVRPRPWVNLLIQPLLIINALFDLSTYFLGPPGRWLRSGPGRSFLAFAGVLLTLLAVGWLVRDWMSWTR